MSVRTMLLALVAIMLGGLLLAGCDGISQAAPIKDLTPDQALAKIKANPNVKLVDVRASFEYRAGHLDGAILLPLPDVQARAKTLLKPEDEIIVYCLSGERSAEAAKIFAKLGYTNVYNLAGGTDQWRARGYPLVK